VFVVVRYIALSYSVVGVCFEDMYIYNPFEWTMFLGLECLQVQVLRNLLE